jgi:predicted nucleic acid-binding protein
MNTLNFLDANVWLALAWSRHVHSERARSWFERADDSPVSLYPLSFEEAVSGLAQVKMPDPEGKKPKATPKK